MFDKGVIHRWIKILSRFEKVLINLTNPIYTLIYVGRLAVSWL